MSQLYFYPLSCIPLGIDNALSLQGLQALVSLKHWITTFVGVAHKDKGVPGPVCPKVPKALALDCIYLAYLDVPPDVTDRALCQLVEDTRWHYRVLPPTEGASVEYKTCLIVFSRTDTGFFAQLERVQRMLKVAYLQEGLMFGKFHPLLQSRGMHNELFRPHQAPVGCFAVRVLAETDASNLTGSTAEESMKRRYLALYLAHYEHKARARYVQHVLRYLREHKDGD